MTQCTAHSKRTKVRCQAQAMHGSNVCYHHGGKTPKGIASPHFKHGKHTPTMPRRLLNNYQEFLANPEYMELRDEIAVIDVRLADLLSKIDTGDTRTAWEIAGDLIGDLADAAEAKKWDNVNSVITSLKEIFMKGFGETETWGQILEAVEQRRKLVESEQKRLTAGQQMITAEQALALVMALQDSVRRHVTDRTILAAISADINRLVAQPAS